MEKVTYEAVQGILRDAGKADDGFAVLRLFIGLTGDHIAALTLNQIAYWSDQSNDQDGWFYKTAQDWNTEIGVSYYQLKRACKILETCAGLDVKTRHVNRIPTSHYRLDPEAFFAKIQAFLQSEDSLNLRNSNLKKVEPSNSRNLNSQIEETSISKLKKLEFHIKEAINTTDNTTENTTESKRGADAPHAAAAPPENPAKPRGKKKTSKPATAEERESIQALFAYWADYHGKKNTRLVEDTDRWRVTLSRLRDGYTLEEIRSAIRGISNSPHHQGQNDTGQKWDDLYHVCKNPQNLEKFIQLDGNPLVPSPVTVLSDIGRRNAEISQQLINRRYGNG
jgi:hypothetical protein